MSYQTYKYDVPGGTGQYTSYSYSSSSGTGGPSYSSPSYGIGRPAATTEKYSYTSGGADPSYSYGNAGYSKPAFSNANNQGQYKGESQGASKKDDYFLTDKLITKTDPKALLPEFSGEGGFGYVNVDMSTQGKDGGTNVKISKSNPKDCSDLMLKYGNISNDEISQKGNLGKTLYGSAAQYASSDAEYDKVVSSCKSKNTNYEDPDFPKTMKSLSGGDGDFEGRCYGCEWKRPSAIYKNNNYKIFEGKIEPRDIKQGILGDCYFLSSCASLAEWDTRIKNCFVSNDQNCDKNVGAYCVRIIERGVPKHVVIDDYFPCDKRGETLFTKGNDEELWVLILEKAWAKNYGSYFQIEAGLTRESMHDLTGAPCVTLFVDEKSKDVLWKEILRGEKNNFAMTTGSLDEEAGADLKGVGLAEGHAYSLLAGFDVPTPSGTQRLVKLRNPWGKFEWSGNWNDNDRKWDNVDPKVKSNIGYSKQDDGIFFMEFKDYIHYFDAAQICYAHDGYKYTGNEFSSKMDEEKYFKVKLNASGHHVFSVSQYSVRHLTQDEQDNHKYAKVVLKVANEKGDVITEVTKNDREVFTGFKRDEGLDESITFQAGVNYVYVKISWLGGRSDKFGLSIYGMGDATIEPCTAEEGKNFGGKQARSGGVSGGYTASSGSGGGYTVNSGGYSATSGGYGATSGGYGATTGGYGATSGGYGATSGGYGGSSGGYGGSSGGYGGNSGGYSGGMGGGYGYSGYK